MKKNGLALLFLITTIVAVVYGYTQKQKADEWEKKAYLMGQQAQEYKVALEQQEQIMIQSAIHAEKTADEAVRKYNESKKK